MQPDLLSERIEEFRAWLAGYGRSGVKIEPEAMVAFDALIADFVTEARNLERRLAEPELPLGRVIADLDEEARATEAFTASIARTKERLVAMRAKQEARAGEQAILDGVAAGKVALFPIAPRPVFGRTSADNLGRSAPTDADVSVEQAIGFFAGVLQDAPKSRFDDRPTFDTPEDCA